MRPSKIDYYMDIATVVSTRSNCCRRNVGAVVVVDDRIVATGYNGTPRGYTNCDEGGCPRCASATVVTSGQALDECICVHAEENAIVSSAYHGGTKLRDGVLYSTLTPCLLCAKLIINAGISKVVYKDFYEVNGVELLRKSGIIVQMTTTPTEILTPRHNLPNAMNAYTNTESESTISINQYNKGGFLVKISQGSGQSAIRHIELTLEEADVLANELRVKIDRFKRR